MDQKLCACHAHLPRRALYDARNIFCAYVCDGCVKEVKQKYRSEIFTDADYWYDEEL